MSSRSVRVVKAWLPFVIIGAALVLLVEVGIQQVYRQDANDPQIQMAEDAAQSTNPTAQVPTQKVNMATSLAPFIQVTDVNQNILAASGQLDSGAALPPAGAFTYAKEHGEDRITWQPKSGVRIATVIVYHNGDHPVYVVAGRNLREVEIRESRLAMRAGLDLLGLLVGTFLAVLVTM